MCSKPYISIFKIDGVPIIPPLVTDKIREEMKELRNLSILFEKKLLIQKKNEMRFRDDVSETNSYLQVSSMIDHTKKTDIFIEIPEVPDDLGFLQKSPQPRLIRSNSYTLLNPSPMLLQHIKTLTTKNSTSLEEIQKVNTKSLVKQGKPSSVRKNLLNEISNKRSPYDSGKKNVPRKRISSAPTENQLKNVMTKVEDEHKSKLKQLLLSQQDEQARLKDSFTKQHSELLKQINHVLARKSPMISEGNNSYIDSDADSIFNCTRDKDPVESGFDSRRDCSRRLFSPESKTVEELRREKASTIITSHVRGYLVRRLFATECVQSIVQTIRDTLLFVLDIHEESEKNNNKFDPSDIKLKAQLLQSLSSSCYSLHRIFFDYSLKDRLLIIGRDRELIRKKLERNRNF